MFGAAVQHVAVAAALAGLVALVCRMTRLGPVARHALWLVVLVKLATPPVLVVRTPWAWADLPRSVAPVPSTATRIEAAGDADVLSPGPDASDAPLLPSTLQMTTPPPRAMPSMPWPIVLVGVWLAGGVAFAGLQAVRIVRLTRLVRRAVPADDALAVRAERLARRLGIPVVPIHVVPGLASPLVWAFRRPALLWPAALPPGLSDACLDGLVVHELAHVKRRDHWVSWLELAAGVVWWWNPLFWYVRSQVREHAELACDACVVHALPHGRRAYAEALVAVCDVMSRRAVPVPAVGVSTGSRRVLERRLVMIMRGHVSSRLSRIGCASIAMLVAATLPAWAQRATARIPPPPPSPVTVPVEVVPEGSRPVRGLTAPVEVAPDGWQTRTAPRIVPAEPARQALPADAQKLIDRFAEQQAEARREADAKIAQQRQDLVKQLQALQDTYTKAGRLDEAVAVRDRVRQLHSNVPSWTLTGATITSRDRVSSRLAPRGSGGLSLDFYRPTPSVTRSVSRSPATQHRGAFSLMNGILVSGDTPAAGSLAAFRDHVGESFTLPVVGATDGQVWGNGVYTDDSILAVAAVHAGVVQPGKLGFARITILPGRDQYEGTTSHGVTSESYGAWEGSYRVERDPDASPVVHLTGALDATPFLSLESYRGQTGVTFTAEVVGSDGTVWGTDVYADDSSIAAAAVHAGLLKVGERGLVKVTVLPGQEKYAGSDRNGVKSESYDKWGGSFRVERVGKGGD